MVQQARANWEAIRAKMNTSPLGSHYDGSTRSALEDTAEQREKVYEELWQSAGLLLLFASYGDILTNKEANETLAEFVRGKIRAIVRDPVTAEKLMPDYYIGTNRQLLDTCYYETFNRDNVELVDLREDPIVRSSRNGIVTAKGEHPLDLLVLATGFDAISGALLRIDPKGRGGVTLKERWRDRFDSYLGITVPDFPNLFMIYDPVRALDAVQHAAGCRAGGSMDRQLPSLSARARPWRDRTDSGCCATLGQRSRRGSQSYALPAR
jgi:cation diffusion facilitator CzcD-associated flavoprotein CzcO